MTYATRGLGEKEVHHGDHDGVDGRKDSVRVIADRVKGDWRHQNNQEVWKTSSQRLRGSTTTVDLLKTQFPAVEIPLAGVRTRSELISLGYCRASVSVRDSAEGKAK